MEPTILRIGDDHEDPFDHPLVKKIVEEAPGLKLSVYLGLLNPQAPFSLGYLTQYVMYKTALYGGVYLGRTISVMQKAYDTTEAKIMWETFMVIMVKEGKVNVNADDLTIAWRTDDILKAEIQETHDRWCDFKGLPKQKIFSPDFKREREVLDVGPEQHTMLEECNRMIREDYAPLLRYGQQERKELFLNA